MENETVNKVVNEKKGLDKQTKLRHCAIFMADCYALAGALDEEDDNLKRILEVTARFLYSEIGKWNGATVAVNNCDKGLKKI